LAEVILSTSMPWAMARVIYRNVINPEWEMARYRFTDGSVRVTYFTPPEASAAVDADCRMDYRKGRL
jgi:hypothetical protein